MTGRGAGVAEEGARGWRRWGQALDAAAADGIEALGEDVAEEVEGGEHQGEDHDGADHEVGGRRA